MKNTLFLYLFLVISCIFAVSCTDIIKDGIEFQKEIDSGSNIDELIEYVRLNYYAKPAVRSLLSYQEDQSEPQWEKCQIFKQVKDTLSICIPIGVKNEGERTVLIANQVDSKNELFLVKLPGCMHDSLSMNLRRRFIVNKNGVAVTYRFVLGQKGQITFARIRDNSTAAITRNGIIDGGSLPEVVIYPGFDYDLDWWWWDYITGLISIPPPPGYTGYTGSGTSNSNDVRPEYYKAANISKDVNVQKEMKVVFQNTKNDASASNGRRERGFWVYYDSTTKQYYTGNQKTGQYVKGSIGTNGSVSPGSSLPSYNGSHVPKTATPVTFVHTHTPLTYEQNCKREVGFSQSDINYADKYNIEMILIDYVGNLDADGKYYIQGGHNINDPTKEYIYTPKK